MCIEKIGSFSTKEPFDVWKVIAKANGYPLPFHNTGPFHPVPIVPNKWMLVRPYRHMSLAWHEDRWHGWSVFPRKEDAESFYRDMSYGSIAITPCQVKGLIYIGSQSMLGIKISFRVAWAAEYVMFGEVK